MKAFVTGGTGFLGTNLAQVLVEAGWELIVLHRATSNLTELQLLKNIKYVVGDVTDRASVFAAMPEKVDAVFHMAASVGNLPHSQEQSRYIVNKLGTENVMAACLERKIGRLIYTTTVLTMDFHAHRPLTDAASRNMWSTDPYIHSKRLADEAVDKAAGAGLDVVYLHPSAIFGAYDKDTWSKMFLEIKRGLPLPFAPPGGGSVCHARKVAEAHLAAFHRGQPGAHYILGGPDVTWLQVAQEIARLLQVPGPTMRLPTPLFRVYGWSEFLISSLIKRSPMLTPHTIDILCETIYSKSDLAQRDLGYVSSTLEEMLSDCHRWMLSVGMLGEERA